MAPCRCIVIRLRALFLCGIRDVYNILASGMAELYLVFVNVGVHVFGSRTLESLGSDDREFGKACHREGIYIYVFGTLTSNERNAASEILAPLKIECSKRPRHHA